MHVVLTRLYIYEYKFNNMDDVNYCISKIQLLASSRVGEIRENGAGFAMAKVCALHNAALVNLLFYVHELFRSNEYIYNTE